MTLQYLNCKILESRISKNEKKIVKLKQWLKEYKQFVKQDSKMLNKRLKDLSEEEYMKFAIETGYVEK